MIIYRGENKQRNGLRTSGADYIFHARKSSFSVEVSKHEKSN